MIQFNSQQQSIIESSHVITPQFADILLHWTWLICKSPEESSHYVHIKRYSINSSCCLVDTMDCRRRRTPCTFNQSPNNNHWPSSKWALLECWLWLAPQLTLHMLPVRGNHLESNSNIIEDGAATEHGWLNISTLAWKWNSQDVTPSAWRVLIIDCKQKVQ